LAEPLLYLILADNFFDLVFAGYLILSGNKVRVVANQEEVEDWQGALLLDPFRSQMICGRLGLPLKKEKGPFTPDFQIISPKYRLDFFWDRHRRDFCFQRDLGPEAQKFSSVLDRLVKGGKEFEEKVREFPLISGRKNAEFLLRFFSRAKALPEPGVRIKDLIRGSGISKELSEILLAPLRIFSPHFQEDSPFFSSALLWRFLLSGEAGMAEGRESWSSFFEILNASKSLLIEEPVSLEVGGKKIIELRMRSGRKIRADLFFASPGTVLELLNEKDRESRRAKALAEKFPRSTVFTHFYEMKAEAWPEAMSERVVWIPGREEEPKEFLICARPLTGATNLAAISYGRRKGEVKPLNEEDLLQNLAGLFPWLKGERMARKKETRVFHQYLKLESSRLFYPLIRTSFENLFLSPSELVPLMSFPGLFRLAERMAEEEKK